MYWQYQKDKNEFEKKYDLSFDEIRNLYSNEIGFSMFLSIMKMNYLHTLNLKIQYCKLDLTRYFY